LSAHDDATPRGDAAHDPRELERVSRSAERIAIGIERSRDRGDASDGQGRNSTRRERCDKAKRSHGSQANADAFELRHDAIMPLRRARSVGRERVPNVGDEDRCTGSDIARVRSADRRAVRRRDARRMPEFFFAAIDRDKVFVGRCERDVAPTIARIIDDQLDADGIE